MIILFVHGWSVRHTETYGDLPRWLAAQTGPDGARFKVESVFLGKYISFDDTVTMEDIARALQHALSTQFADQIKAGQRFAVITHSTGGPVVRLWMDLFWKKNLAQCPLSHLIMLAPANHGSALAQLGKSRLSRMKGFFQGVEPGQRVLDWLELGSAGSWALNASWLDYDCVAARIFPFVLTGQRIDRRLYDPLNSYTGEAGSDGVVRVAAANANYSLLRLTQQNSELKAHRLRRAAPSAFGVLPGLSHSGKEMGILRSVNYAEAAEHPAAQWVLRCLHVRNAAEYRQVADGLAALTERTQAEERIELVQTLLRTRSFPNPRHTMIVFRIVDDRGETLSDYDLYFTAGPKYDENQLPEGFSRDRQRNQLDRGKLTYYLNYDAMAEGLAHPKLGGLFGFFIVARPGETRNRPKLVFYRPLSFNGTVQQVRKLLNPNETLMVEIQLERRVDAAVFQIDKKLEPGPIGAKPTGEQFVIDWRVAVRQSRPQSSRW
jgi:hypothetical protein